MIKPMLAASAAAFLLDQASKYYILWALELEQVGRIDVFPPFLRFTMAWNRGVNFGLFSSDEDVMRWVLVVLSIAISCALAIWALKRNTKIFAVGAGLVIGGAIGNALDRVVFGAVVDFLNMSCCGFYNPYAFNIADVAIFAGAAVLIIYGDKKGPAKG
ncbi:MAG: signal peptidase II [Pikeienuella sp.]